MEEKQNKNEDDIFDQKPEEETEEKKKGLFGGLFSKNKKESLEEVNDTQKEVGNDNIFSELSGELDFGEEEIVEKIEEKKDKVYYLKKISSLIYYFNLLLFIGVLSFGLYIYIQKSDKFLDNPYLDSICFVILGNEIDKTYGSCSSVTSLYNDYNNKMNKLKQNMVNKISTIGVESYVIENFINSKEVSFLLDKNNNRLKVIDIINDFDVLKNSFLGSDKKQIICSNFEISKDFVLKVSCDFYSSSWDRGIIGPYGDKTKLSDLIGGTSISLASSFLNYIEKNPKYNFKLLNKQDVFSSESVLDGFYTNKTNVTLELKYSNLSDNLSL